MENKISFNTYPIDTVLDALLIDNTTGQNIIFATNVYIDKTISINETSPITKELLLKYSSKIIRPRIYRSIEQQTERTKRKAEIFTPSWICNKMNNHCDEEWFKRPNVFNIEIDTDWVVNTNPIQFNNSSDWKKYVESKRLEITCGEAPYIVSRYDSSNGKDINIDRRIGILDRKIRIINENVCNENEWLEWVQKAFQSVYGFEFQGDNLLMARINLLLTYVDYFKNRLNKFPTSKELHDIANIISWNFWQMDGITGSIPLKKPITKSNQLGLFDFEVGINDTAPESVDCVIFDWKTNKKYTYNSIRGGN